MATTAGRRSNSDGPLSWDFSASAGENEIDYFINNTINASLGSRSPTDFRAGVLTQQDFNLAFETVYQWQTGLAEPVNIAVGAERREETYKIKAGDRASYEVGPLAVAGLPSGSNRTRALLRRLDRHRRLG